MFVNLILQVWIWTPWSWINQILGTLYGLVWLRQSCCYYSDRALKSNIKICFQKILNFSSFGIFWHSVGSECSDGSRSLQEVDLINIFYLLNVHNFLWITLIEILSIFLFYKQKVRGLSNSLWTASLPRLRNRLEKSGKSAVFLNIYHLGYTLHCTLYKYNS